MCKALGEEIEVVEGFVSFLLEVGLVRRRAEEWLGMSM